MNRNKVVFYKNSHESKPRVVMCLWLQNPKRKIHLVFLQSWFETANHSER